MIYTSDNCHAYERIKEGRKKKAHKPGEICKLCVGAGSKKQNPDRGLANISISARMSF